MAKEINRQRFHYPLSSLMCVSHSVVWVGNKTHIYKGRVDIVVLAVPVSRYGVKFGSVIIVCR